MDARRTFSNFRKKLPPLRDQGFFNGMFFVNKTGEVERVGSTYSNDQFSFTKTFVFLLEKFSNESPDLTELESEEYNGRKLYRDYKPDFGFISQQINNNSFTWNEENLIFTILDSNFASRKELYDFFDLVQNSEGEIPELAVFRLLRYLPSNSKNWKLRTAFASHSVIRDDLGDHWIKVLRGNYGKKNDYLNLELRFGDGTDSEEIEEAMEIPETFVRKESEVLLREKIKKQELSGYQNLERANALIKKNKEEQFTIIVHNNSTTQDFEKYKYNMADLLLKTWNSLENYSVLESLPQFKGR